MRYGVTAPSNMNTPISYVQFVILNRFGLCGVKISLLREKELLEIY
jgi:hypothetical protein